MSQPNFGYLAQYNPKANTQDFSLPIPAKLKDDNGVLIQPVLVMRNAGQSNKPYFNAVAKLNAKTGQARRLAQGRIDSETVARNRQQDRMLFPKHVIFGWRGIYDQRGLLVEFSVENCEALLNALPDWIMDEVRNFAAVPANFLHDEDPADDEIEEAAGN